MLFTNIPVALHNGVVKEPPNGFQVVAIRPYSSHPSDQYLFVMLCEREVDKVKEPYVDPYVTWTYNAQSRGYGNGHYFQKSDAALSDFLRRGL
jgi:hypothetical protein